jgi:ATP-dependent RNA helicase RhlE
VTETTFSNLGLINELQQALRAKNYLTPTPIQARAIPPLLEGKDLLGIAQTGTGKTAAFGLPLLQHLAASRTFAGRKGVRALILAPTRELALQIAEEFRAYAKNLPFRMAVVMGGVSQGKQVQALKQGVDILIATPGRLLDLMQQRCVRLDGVSHLVLDEADRMLDMGFIRDVRRIIAGIPRERQTGFFSATMPNDVARLAQEILRNPVRVEVSPAATTVEKVDQRVFFVKQGDKRRLLLDVLKDAAVKRVIVFSRTKHQANKVTAFLDQAGVRAAAIHGNKSQGARQAALRSFRDGHARVLVATDIAARGIDVDGVTHVINFEIPNIPESYVHRIGRTARAGAAGIALSFCDGSERAYLRDIEKLTRTPLTVVAEHAFHDTGPETRAEEPRQHARSFKSRGRWRRGKPYRRAA